MTLETAHLTPRERYQLLTSLVVPRPIAWISTYGADGLPNLAPFSYFMAVSHAPMLVAVSIGTRRGEPKDSYRNILAQRAFCVNVVTGKHLEAMNQTAGEYEASVDEFAHAGLAIARAESVEAPYVADGPAVLECRLYEQMVLAQAQSAILVGEVLRVHLSEALVLADGTCSVETASLDPVGRLWGDWYARVGEMERLARPR